MITYLQCRECREIHREGRLSRELKPGTLDLIGLCPTCGCNRFDQVEGVCDLCEQQQAAPNDDFCPACAAQVTREEQDFFADDEAEPEFYRKAS